MSENIAGPFETANEADVAEQNEPVDPDASDRDEPTLSTSEVNPADALEQGGSGR
jgi:hypothetical protein